MIVKRLLMGVAIGLFSTPIFAALIPIGVVPSSGNGLGAVNSVVTFQNTGAEFGCVGIAGTGTTTTGATQCFGGVVPPGGVTHEQTGSGNNTYSLAALGFAPTGVNTLSNLVLIFNGNEGGGADQPFNLPVLALNLFTPTGTLVGSFSTNAPFSESAFPGVGNAGYGFQLDFAQAFQANLLFLANPGLIMGASASVTNANSGPETVFVSRIDSLQPDPLGDDPIPEPSTLLTIGLSLVGIGCVYRRRNRSA